MNADRDSIEAAIRRVQLGELSPAEATRMLLGETSLMGHTGKIFPSRAEQLSQLIGRLGSPPPDVLDRWCQRVQSFTVAAHLAGASLPSVDPDQWYVASSGDLLLREHQVPAIDLDSVEPGVRDAAQQHAELFRRQFVAFDEPVVNCSEPVTQQEPAGQAKPTESRSMSSNSDSGRSRVLRSALIGVSLAVSVGAIGSILWMGSRTSSVSVAPTDATRPVEPSVTHNARIDSPGTNAVADDTPAVASQAVPDQLEMFETSSYGDASIDISAELLTLEMSMPSMPILSTEPDSVADSNRSVESHPSQSISDRKEAPVSGAAMLAASGGDDPLAESTDVDQPDESPQPTRQASETTIRLPKIDDAESAVTLFESSLTSPTIDFPIDVDLDLRPMKSSSPAAWSVVDSKRKELLATIRVGKKPDGHEQTMFQWTDAAKRSTTANRLYHGSLRDGSGPRIFLRPKIVSESYAISFDRPDARPSWDLSSPLPPRVARLSVGFDLPAASKQSDGIELGWIEPVDATSPHRTRGLAVLTPTDGETIAVGIRFDFRCTKTLSARVRTFGRLDAKTPWQLISRPVLENAADQLTARATKLSQMSSQMAAAYSHAGTDQRRMLRPHRDAIEQQSRRVVEISKRLAELQSLISRIENEVRIRIRLWVQWPQSQQDLLVMDVAQAG